MNPMDKKLEYEFLDWQKHDFYALLGVTRMATGDEIRKAYRRKALDYHPDRWPLDSPERTDAEKRFLKLTEARDTLLDTVARETYDRDQDLTQQAWLDAIVTQYQAQVPVKPPPKPSSDFKETLKNMVEQTYAQSEYRTGESQAQYDDEEDETPKRKGLPEYSRKNAAAYYYSQGVRFAARGHYRRALYAMNNAKMLDPEIEISPYLLNKIRSQAYYSNR